MRLQREMEGKVDQFHCKGTEELHSNLHPFHIYTTEVYRLKLVLPKFQHGPGANVQLEASIELESNKYIT